VKVLTDTHTLVWALTEPEKLGRAARRALDTSPFTASVANLGELVWKKRKPGALLSDPIPWWDRYVARSEIPTLALRVAHIEALAALPDYHQDPFDRILLAQAAAENLTLVSCDKQLAQYGVRVIW